MDDKLNQSGSKQNMGEHNPYRQNMQTAQDEVRPEFLNGADGKKRGQKEQEAKTGGVAESLRAAESAAAGEGLNQNGVSAREGEENPNGFNYTETRTKGKGKQKGKFGIKKASVGIVVFLIVLFGAAITALGNPIFQIGNIDFNLMDALGFLGTVGILEKQARYVTGDEMEHGRVPDAYAGRLAANGLMVGQVASNGDFVRTNVYIANVDELKDLAVLGNFQVQPSEGELAILYDGEVITADNFVAAVESNPVMYADFSKAADIGASYYYGEDAEGVMKDAGLDRSIFAGWEDTGDEEKNRENFDKIAEESLNGKSDVTVGGYTGVSGETSRINDDLKMAGGIEVANSREGSNGTSALLADEKIRGKAKEMQENSGVDSESANEDNTSRDAISTESMKSTAEGSEVSLANSDDADSIISEVASKIHGAAKAVQLLNAAVSASEPYSAAKTFMFIESPIQQTRISEKSAPIPELFEAMQKETEVEVSTGGETKKVKYSVLTDPNFVAAVASGKYSKSDAAYFSRDSILFATKVGSDSNIRDTVVATEGQKKSDIVLGMKAGEDTDESVLMAAKGAINLTMVQKGSDLFSSYVGGEWAIEGGSEVSNMINRRAVGAMGSDAPTLTLYNKEVKDELARKAEAERATKSPFDISSPYTFMGSLVRKLSSATIQSNAIMRSNGTVGSMVGTVANMTGDSVNGLFSSVVADGTDDSFGMTFGDHCETVNSAADVEGNIFCSAHGSISLKYMDWGQDEWGDMKKEKGYKVFVLTGMDRMATIGVKSADVCKKYNEEYGGVINNLLGFLGIYKDCDGVDPDIATGAKNTFSSSNGNKEDAEKYGAFARYDQVVSLLEGSSTAAAQIREEYYAKHPQDNSEAGRLARISGLSKSEAEVALAYADYLTFVAQYDPSTRYAFGSGLQYEKPANTLVEHASQVAVELYVMWHGQTEYSDLRGRTQVV